ncbi:MAG: EAL domain-containing protein [Gammaproteobacteria bacterium]|nr:EAL domain-containing protein [Gammaproteobacteria bacterium]
MKVVDNSKRVKVNNIRSDLATFSLIILLIVFYQQDRLNYLIYDAFIHNINSSAPEHTAIIEIDDRSLAVLGAWPWDRDIHAELLTKLTNYQVKAVGFDILFGEHSQSSKQQDLLFADAIKQANNVVLPIAPSKSHVGGTPELLPQPVFAAAAHKLGHVDFELDRDGIVRQGFLYAGFQSSRWPSFSLALAQTAKKELPKINSEITQGHGWTRREPVHVNYNLATNQSRLTHYSYIDVLSGRVERPQLANKIILVGMNGSAMGDQFATPLSAAHDTMPGVEINAHMVNTLINNNPIKPFSRWQQLLLTFIASFITLLAFIKVSAKQLFTSLMVAMSLAIISSALVFYLTLNWFAPISLLLCQTLLFGIMNVVKNNKLTLKISNLNYDLSHDASTELLNANGLRALLETTFDEGKEWQLFRLQVGKINGISELIGKDANAQFIQQVTVRLKALLPEHAFGLSRLHNTEFAFITPTLSERKTTALCNNIIKSLGARYSLAKENFKMPINIGVSYGKFADSASEVQAQALAALEHAQENILSSYRIYSNDLKAIIEQRTQIESDLTKALENNEFEIYYQPQVTAASGKIVGAEALVRWHHPTKGLISPNEFIPVAENTGMIIEIGQWVLETACDQAAKWQNLGHNNFRIAVNLSPVQFSQPNVVQNVKHVLEKTGLKGSSLELELTENAILEDINGALKAFKELKQLGVTLSIDDFGTGYSSLSYLRKFPMDRIKIDRSFIHELLDDKESQEITLAIISMAHNLNMRVIAEGIESEQQYAFLHENNCEELQGYYFGRPVAVAELEMFLEKN